MKRVKKLDFESIDDIEQEPDKFNKYYKKISTICNGLPYKFRERLRYLRESMGYTREQLEENSYISVQTIKQIEINSERGYSIETILALCIGMNLPPEFSFDLIRIGGFNIETNSCINNCMYCFILRNMYNLNIDDVNQFLEINGVPPLSLENKQLKNKKMHKIK